MGVTTLEATTYTTLQAAVHALVAAALGTAFTLVSHPLLATK